MSKDIVTDIEIESGFVARDPKSLPKITDLEKFIEYAIPLSITGEMVGVNYPDRVEWLEANGYEVTRENLIDASLSVKKQEK